MSKFKVGDEVTAFGLVGTVSQVDPNGVRVNFLEAGFAQYFLQDGREDIRHKSVALYLVDKPKTMIKKKLYIAVRNDINQYSRYGGRDSSLAFEKREHAENQFSSPYQIVETEIDVEE